jgi:hypothetical protein
MHAYFIDYKENTGRLYYSASKRLNDNADKKLIGYANRYNHHEDMLTLKLKGMRIYDWGGAYVGNTDKVKINITKFKRGFGGQLVQPISYYSLSAIFSFVLRNILHKINK